MNTTPAHTKAEPEASEEERRILRERDATFEKDNEAASSEREALAAIRKRLKTVNPPAPR